MCLRISFRKAVVGPGDRHPEANSMEGLRSGTSRGFGG